MAKTLLDSNAPDVEDWFEEQAEKIKDDAGSLPQRAAKATEDRAFEEVPVDTGALKESLTREENEVYSELEYAPHVGLGTIYMDQQDYLWGPAKEEFLRLINSMTDD
jgi:hypothetical protein